MIGKFYRMTAAFILLLCLYAVQLYAAAAPLVGSGTENDPYQIASTADYRDFAAYINSGGADAAGKAGGVYARLAADLNFDGSECPSIGTAEHPFRGVFDGDGYVIRGAALCNLTRGTEESAVGLFAFAENAALRALHVENMTVDLEDAALPGTVYGGMLVGKASCGVSFSACSVDGTMALAFPKARIEAGGFCGSVESLTRINAGSGSDFYGLEIADCAAHVEISAETTGRFLLVGGAVGNINIGGSRTVLSVQRVVTDGNILAKSTSIVYLGGIAGNVNYEPEWDTTRTAQAASRMAADTSLMASDTSLMATDVPFAELFSACGLASNASGGYLGSIYGYTTSLKMREVYCADDRVYRSGNHSASGTAVVPAVWKEKAFWCDTLGLSEEIWTFDGEMPRLMRREPTGLAAEYRDGVLRISGSVELPACCAVIALYGADGRLFAARTVSKGEEAFFEAVIDCETEPASVKVFFLESLSVLRPLAEEFVWNR